MKNNNNTIPYTKKQLYKIYLKKINKILDDLEWKCSFTGEEMCDIIYKIINDKLIQNRGYKLPFTEKTLYKIYSKEVSKSKLSGKEWNEKYSFNNKEHGVRELTEIIYNIISSELEKRTVIFEKLKNKINL